VPTLKGGVGGRNRGERGSKTDDNDGAHIRNGVGGLHAKSRGQVTELVGAKSQVGGCSSQ